MVRTEATADDSLAAIRARSKFGMAIAAMIRMIATTISNSISEKPFCFRISFSLFSDLKFLVFTDRLANMFALCWPESGLPVRVTKESGCPPCRWFILMAHHAFPHHAFPLGAASIPAISCQILSPIDKLCQIATGRTILDQLAVPGDRESKADESGELGLRKAAAGIIIPALAWRRTHENDVSGCRIVRHQSGRAGAAAKCIQPGPDQIRSGSPGFGTGSANSPFLREIRWPPPETSPYV